MIPELSPEPEISTPRIDGVRPHTDVSHGQSGSHWGCCTTALVPGNRVKSLVQMTVTGNQVEVERFFSVSLQLWNGL
eukprot:1009346-Rhodomonas_salina.1